MSLIQQKLITTTLLGMCLLPGSWSLAADEDKEDKTVIHELTVTNSKDSAVADFSLKRDTGKLPLGRASRASEILPTLSTQTGKSVEAEVPGEPDRPADEAGSVLRITPATLKDAEFSERLARLVGKEIAVSHAADNGVETANGKLDSYDDTNVKVSGKEIARNRVVTITFASTGNPDTLFLEKLAQGEELRYQRQVPKWSLAYRLDVSTAAKTASTLAASAVFSNPTPQPLADADVHLREGSFSYDLTTVSLGPNRVGIFPFPQKLNVSVKLLTEAIFDPSADTAPQEAIEIVNGQAKAPDLIGGQVAVFREQQFVGTFAMSDLLHARNSAKAILPPVEKFQQHLARQFIRLSAVPGLSTKVTRVPYQPQSLASHTLTSQEAYSITITNSRPNARELIIVLPAATQTVLAANQGTDSLPSVVKIPAAKANKSGSAEVAVLLKATVTSDVHSLSAKQLTELAGRSGLSTELSDALSNLADLRKRLDDNKTAGEALVLQLQRSILATDALVRSSNDRRTATRLAKAQQQLGRIEQAVDDNSREEQSLLGEQATFLFDLDVK